MQPPTFDCSWWTVPVPKPTVTKNKNPPLGSDSEPRGDTETNGPGLGGPFPCAMDTPIPDYTEVSDRLPSISRAPVKFNFLVMGLSSTELGLMTSQLGLCPYRDRLSLRIETDGSHPILNPREIPKQTGLVSVARFSVLWMCSDRAHGIVYFGY